jgi:murein DD-endopeptidase MepM/ murein hydrolase activator NlpD
MKAFARGVILPCAILSCFLLLACDDDGRPTKPRDTSFFAEDPFFFELEAGSRTTFKIDGINGTIQITGDPSATSVSVEGKRRVESDSVEDAENHLAVIKVENTTSDTEIRVRTDQPPDTQGRNYIVNYTVTLPQGMMIDAGNANGVVSVQSMKNRVSIDNANGDITMESIEGNALATLGNGSIVASVTLPLNGFIDLSVGNGDISLAIPQNTSAALSATVANGTVSVSNLDITNPVVTANSVSGTMGKGHGTITLTVANGTIAISGIGSDYTSFEYPLEVYHVIQEFGNRNPYFGLRYHAAEDARGMGGTPVYAIANGVVSYSGPMGGYGWLITVDHAIENVYSLYGHLSTRRAKTAQGEQVSRGERIAYLADDDEDGSGGEYPDWTPHLHFGIREGSISDYPSSGDSRWMAGYTAVYPTTLGWMDPTDFIEESSSQQ